MTISGCSEPEVHPELINPKSVNENIRFEYEQVSEILKQPQSLVSTAQKEGLKHALVIGGYFGASRRLGCEGLPKNTRQTEEGYWLGSRPDAEDIEELHARGIELVLTLSVIPRRELALIKEKIQKLGMKQIYLPFGRKFPPSSKFMSDVMSYRPEQILIHCEHGSDRTGAMMAFILSARHGWPISKALYSVILPSAGDINALSRILQRRGYDVDTAEYEMIIGMYSAEKNGGYGGMKVRFAGGNYYRLIETTITRKELYIQNESKQRNSNDILLFSYGNNQSTGQDSVGTN